MDLIFAVSVTGCTVHTVRLQSVRLCYGYGLRLAWHTADSIRRFDSKTNRTADSIRDSIRTKKKRFAGPYMYVH